MKDECFCKMQPNNFGLQCFEQKEERSCKYCGWNPKVAEERRRETLRKIEEKEKEKND